MPMPIFAPQPLHLHLQLTCSLTPIILILFQKRENRKEQQHFQHTPFNPSSKGAHCHHLQQQLPPPLAQTILMLPQLRKGYQQQHQQMKKDQPRIKPGHHRPHQKPIFSPAGSGSTSSWPPPTLHSNPTRISSLHYKPSLLQLGKLIHSSHSLPSLRHQSTLHWPTPQTFQLLSTHWNTTFRTAPLHHCSKAIHQTNLPYKHKLTLGLVFPLHLFFNRSHPHTHTTRP